MSRDLLVLVILAAILGTLGGPPPFHPDSLGKRALEVLENGGNPGFFRYPGLLIYLHAAVGLAVHGVLSAVDRADGAGVHGFWIAHPNLLHDLGHLVTVFFSVAGVVLTYLVAHRIVRDRAVAFLAAFFLATSVLWMADTHFATVDVPLATLTLAVTYFTLRSTAAGAPLTAGGMAFLGLWVGLAAAAKYPGALAAVTVAGSTWGRYRSKRRWLVHLLGAGATALVVFLAANPYLLVETDAFRADLAAEIQHARTGHLGYTTHHGWLFHLGTSLGTALRVPALLLALVGLGWLVATRSVGLPAKLAVLLFPVTAYALIGHSHLAFQRYMLPVLPTVAMLAGLGAHAAWLFARSRRLPSERAARRVVFVLAFATALPNAFDVVRHDLLLLEQDTRSVLRRVVGETELETEALTVFAATHLSGTLSSPVTTLASLRSADFDLVVFDSFDHDRYLYHLDARGRPSGHLALATAMERQDLHRAHRVVLSPFTRPKPRVPFSPKSLYSPYPPDLRWRRAPGPFIEIYARDRDLADRLARACERVGASCERGPADAGYYFRAVEEITASR